MASLAKHNSETGEMEIYSEYTGEVLLEMNTTDIELFQKLQKAIRVAEFAALQAGKERVSKKVQEALGIFKY